MEKRRRKEEESSRGRESFIVNSIVAAESNKEDDEDRQVILPLSKGNSVHAEISDGESSLAGKKFSNLKNIESGNSKHLKISTLKKSPNSKLKNSDLKDTYFQVPPVQSP